MNAFVGLCRCGKCIDSLDVVKQRIGRLTKETGDSPLLQDFRAVDQVHVILTKDNMEEREVV
jgi:hypothetical protein